tara:strand:- start:4414 stop:4815 length:402 start_codon:yes stop_codon:yes gene_type:complete
MQIKYKVLGYAEDEHTVQVRYYTDTTTEEDLAMRDPETGEIIRHSDGSVQTCRTDVNITVWQVPAPTGAELEEFLSRNAPKYWFDILEKVKDPTLDTSLSSIKGIVGVEFDAVEPPEPEPAPLSTDSSRPVLG